jgi:integrase
MPGTHLGYQRKEAGKAGRWLLRRHLGRAKYQTMALGLADDVHDANGTTILDYAQAKSKATAMVAKPGGGKIERLTVRQAMKVYCEFKEAEGKSVADIMSRGTVHILPTLGDLVVSELTAETLRKWLITMANSPAQTRPKKGKVRFRPAPEGEEAIRKRRSTSNRVLGMLKAVLNHAYDEGHVAHRDAWGRKLKPFKGVDSARVRYLTIAEGQRLINACEPNFRKIVRGALETGARYAELGRCEVADFNPDAGTLTIRKSKTSKARHIILTDEGTTYFKTQCAGRAGAERLFLHPYCPPSFRKKGEPAPAGDKLLPWGAAEQGHRAPLPSAQKLGFPNCSLTHRHHHDFQKNLAAPIATQPTHPRPSHLAHDS